MPVNWERIQELQGEIIETAGRRKPLRVASVSDSEVWLDEERNGERENQPTPVPRYEVDQHWDDLLKRGHLTTAWGITELANTFSRPVNRQWFSELLNDLRNDPRVQIVPPTQELFDRGIDLYARRPDKDWSLTDCIFFVVMEEHGLQEAASVDHHFEQAGFRCLLKQPRA